MATRMLIDARHSEETRVAVLKGNRIEELDFESADHKQIKGNIYLAKVTRVEPSLQAAFVDFGGNRHGFLAFNDIHPDYYQIPLEDREALLAEEQAAAEEEAALRAADEDEEDENLADSEDDNHDDDHGDEDEPDEDDEDSAGIEEIDTSEKEHVDTIEDGHVEDGDNDDSDDSDGSEEASESDESDDSDSEDDDKRSRGGRGRGGRGGRARRQSSGGRQQKGGRRGGGSRAKEMDEVRAKRYALRRRYKIQDVIQRRQVLLVQVEKEERGNKGAALTTYLSLAGRYCVLMPNSSHGGGISRKISNGMDRKRLKQIVSDLTLPKSMGLIVRTAGLSRTKTEIKRDFDYLARLWDIIRERTLGSSAPNMIHSDSDLIKRAIRDIYNREIEEVLVEGEEGYKAAKSFMKLLMPSHARRVKQHSDPVPLFQRYGAEDQLTAMYDPVVQLKSGGYLVINPTEALVSIDINSGRSTKQHGIEQTALSTNLEAAREIARQLRLRDMAGLVVIDFIDMEHNSSVRKVERTMKDSLKNDRARIQVGRISSFGLMEMSRQRLRTGVLEATTRACPHCDASGLVRTASSAGLSALRLLEDEAAKGKGTIITLHASTEAAIYLLNTKRGDLAEIERLYSVTVEVQPEGEEEGAKMRVSSSGPRPTSRPKFEPIVDDIEDDDLPEEENFDSEDDEDEVPKKRRRRRGGRGRNRNRDQDRDENAAPDDEPSEDSETSENERSSSEESDEEEPKPRRRRGSRGGRGRGRKKDAEATSSEESETRDADEGSSSEAPQESSDEAPSDEEAPKPKRRTRKKPVAKESAEETSSESDGNAEDEKPAKPKRTRKRKPKSEDEASSADSEGKKTATRATKTAAKASATSSTSSEAVSETAPSGEAEAGDQAPRRGGWWQRTFGA